MPTFIANVPGPRSPEESGKIGWALMWLLGVPLPVLLIAWLLFFR